ncbi:putative Rpp4C4 [Senna tora]|uniref:Putative Rpp4C4 n=1 Tax=Senna tora TaxID=362788 RepID=A0A834XIB9_9FABA|nr:putative Rpp4C4 [Senna tora]
MKLRCLTKLKSFYPGKHTLECPSLETLDVYLCEALQMFSLDHYDFPHEQALFFIEKVSPNLWELALNDKDAMRILNGHYANIFHSVKMLHLQYFQEASIMFLNDFLERFPNTTTIQLRYCSFETLFLSEGIDHCEGSTQIIKNLWLYQLEQLKHIWNDDSLSDPFVQNLKSLRVVDCSSLTSLAPPSISFKNLTTLEVKDCKGLIYLMKSSTARSLMQLTSLTIENCEMVEEVVMISEGESEEEIKFDRLVKLKLTSLSSFKSFCSGKHTFIFSSLRNLEVKRCPKMQNFSSGVIIAPILKIVEVDNGKKYWTEDLNTTLRKLVMKKVHDE